jgi:hypothetical protein
MGQKPRCRPCGRHVPAEYVQNDAAKTTWFPGGPANGRIQTISAGRMKRGRPGHARAPTGISAAIPAENKQDRRFWRGDA